MRRNKIIVRPCLWLALLLFCVPGAPSLAQAVTGTPGLSDTLGGGASGPRLIEIGRPAVPATSASSGRSTLPARGGSVRPAAAQSNLRVVLSQVVVSGATAVPAADLRALWWNKRGQTLALPDISALADAVGALYKRAGLALYTVSVPAQGFAGGVVRLRVVEGYVGQVVIGGDTQGADMSLLQHYAAAIVADRPLHQARLERQVLLMSAIPGLTLNSRFDPIPASNGGVRLVLAVSRKRWDFGIGVNNQGFPLLANTQIQASVVINSLFQQGDRTQLVMGVPVERFGSFQYGALSEQQPIGHSGMTISSTVGALHTKTQDLNISGEAVFGDLLLAYPILRGIDQSLTASLALDALDSNNALVGQTLTDERTRVIRGGLTYGTDDHLLAASLDAADSASLVLSEGLDGLGARRGSVNVGGPGFTKAVAKFQRDQPLPKTLVLRLRAAGQVAAEHLPASEQFTYGGAIFGRAFDYGTINGDSGLEGAAELAWPVPQRFTTRFLAGTEIFGFVDAGRVWNLDTRFAPREEDASSGGFGARFNLLKKSVLLLEAATPIGLPRLFPGEISIQRDWRFVFDVSAAL